MAGSLTLGLLCCLDPVYRPLISIIGSQPWSKESHAELFWFWHKFWLGHFLKYTQRPRPFILDTPYGTPLAKWEAGVKGLDWLDELVKEGNAIDLSGNGYSFQRSTHVNAGTFKLRLSVHANQFFNEIFPDMKRARILEETAGSSGHPRYKLGVPMSVIASALAESRGSYTRCLELISERSSHR